MRTNAKKKKKTIEVIEISDDEVGLTDDDEPVRKAPRTETPRDIYNLGLRYHIGRGVEKDTTKAVELYRQA
eukprot:11825-Eustigmatos_ZCMA.PRE.1